MQTRNWLAAATLAVTMIGAGCGGSSKSSPKLDGGSPDQAVQDMKEPTDGGQKIDFASIDLATISADTACSDQATAFCNRLNTCNPRALTVNYNGDCVARRKQACLNNQGAPGTSSTPSKAELCAMGIQAETCDDYDNGVTPTDCLPIAGTLTNSTACNYDGQCQSTFCAIPANNNCGTCTALVSVNGACVNGDCPTGLYCSKVSTTCVAKVTSAGGACENEAACGAHLTCVGFSVKNGVLGTCVANVTTAGAACDQNKPTPAPTPSPGPTQADCDASQSLFCYGTKANNKTCITDTYVAPSPVPSPSCGLLTGTSGPTWGVCTAGSTCQITDKVGMTGYCSGPALDNAPCDTTINDACLAPSKCIGTAVDGGIMGTCVFPGTTPYCQ